MRILAIVLFHGYLLPAQRVEVGIEGGIRTSDAYGGVLSSESKRYIVGPTVDIRLTKRFSVEADVLYQRLGFTGNYGYGIGNYGYVRERSNSWQFPAILKYRLPVLPLHPYVGIGYPAQILGWSDIASGARGYTPYRNEHSTGEFPVTHGIVFSGGVSLAAGHLRLTPELRYTYSPYPYLSVGYQNGWWISNQNEVSVMMGIRWH
jgi:hypothetical protein